MAYDRYGKEIYDYTYDVAQRAISEGRDEIVFLFEDTEYCIGVSNQYIVKDYLKQHPDIILEEENPFSPNWYCCSQNGDVLIIAPKEKILDSILIKEHHLKDIWSKIILL